MQEVGFGTAVNCAQLRAHIQRDPTIGTCDDNPFGVQVPLRATLLAALDGSGDVLRFAPAASTAS